MMTLVDGHILCESRMCGTFRERVVTHTTYSLFSLLSHDSGTSVPSTIDPEHHMTRPLCFLVAHDFRSDHKHPFALPHALYSLEVTPRLPSCTIGSYT
jgi:hypothetical protein